MKNKCNEIIAQWYDSKILFMLKNIKEYQNDLS